MFFPDENTVVFILKAAFLILETYSEEKNAAAYFAIKLFVFFLSSRTN